MNYKNFEIEMFESTEFKEWEYNVYAANGLVFKTSSVAGNTFATTPDQALKDAYSLIDRMLENK